MATTSTQGRRPLRVGLIGAGLMGRAHAQAFLSAASMTCRCGPFWIFWRTTMPRAAANLGFSRSTGDWRDVASDPEIDIVVVATPNNLHAPIALAAIANGKAVYCEKPLSTSVENAVAMTEAAEAASEWASPICSTP